MKKALKWGNHVAGLHVEAIAAQAELAISDLTHFSKDELAEIAVRFSCVACNAVLKDRYGKWVSRSMPCKVTIAQAEVLCEVYELNGSPFIPKGSKIIPTRKLVEKGILIPKAGLIDPCDGFVIADTFTTDTIKSAVAILKENDIDRTSGVIEIEAHPDSIVSQAMSFPRDVVESKMELSSSGVPTFIRRRKNADGTKTDIERSVLIFGPNKTCKVIGVDMAVPGSEQTFITTLLVGDEGKVSLVEHKEMFSCHENARYIPPPLARWESTHKWVVESELLERPTLPAVSMSLAYTVRGSVKRQRTIVAVIVLRGDLWTMIVCNGERKGEYDLDQLRSTKIMPFIPNQLKADRRKIRTRSEAKRYTEWACIVMGIARAR